MYDEFEDEGEEPLAPETRRIALAVGALLWGGAMVAARLAVGVPHGSAAYVFGALAATLLGIALLAGGARVLIGHALAARD